MMSYLAEAEKSGGAMSRLDADADKLGEIKLFGDLGDLEHKGASPWLVAARMWAFRHGPAAWPLSGFGCLAASVSDAADVVLVAFPAEGMCTKGITPENLANFLETPSGPNFISQDAVFVPMAGSRVVWLPYGWLGSPIVVPKGGSNDTAESETKEDDAAVGIIAVFNPLLTQAVSQLSAPTWQAIMTWNKQHLERNGARSTWSARAELVNKNCGGCGRCMSAGSDETAYLSSVRRSWGRDARTARGLGGGR